MRLAHWVLLHLLLALAMATKVPPRDFLTREYFIVEIDTSAATAPLHDFIVAYNTSFRFEHPVRGLDDHFVFSVAKSHPHALVLGNHNSNNFNLMKRAPGLEHVYDALVGSPHLRLVHMLPPKRLERRMPVPIYDDEDDNENEPELLAPRGIVAVDSSMLPLKEASEKLGIDDPIFSQQWHLINTINPGNDVNVKNVWYSGNMGQNVTVAVIDDGLDYELPDLADNFNAKGLWDFNDNTDLPRPRLFDDYHGTRCAGEIAAVKNDVCGIGVAYKAQVAGIRILSGLITSEEEAAAMIYGLDVNDIYSCSWGPTDNGMTVAGPDMVVKKAMVKGIQDGRDGKGALYVFASGNGGRVGDQCNFDGYTNSIYSITVGAIDFRGLHPLYAEACLAVMVVTYSSGSKEHIHTTDIKKKCSATHGGTSAAAPLAAGIYALVLLANPNLTWRDLQYVSAMAAVPVNEDDGEYQVGALGQKYSHKYGYGKLDAEKLVEVAKSWTNVKPQAWHYLDVQTVGQTVKAPENADSDVLSSTITISADDLRVMNLERVEHVTVKVNIDSLFRGKIAVRLVSPTGTVSYLARYRPMDLSNSNLHDWTFMSVAHFGEAGVGDWKLEVHSGPNNMLTFKDWQLRFFGESIDADKAETYDVQKDYAAVRRDRLGSGQVASSEAQVISSTVASTKMPESSANLLTEPATSISTVAPSDTESKVPAPAMLAPVDDETSPEGEDEDHEGATKHYSSDHAGQYFMALAVVGFLVVIAIMKWHKPLGSSRRRRREDFEFDIIPGEDYSDSEDLMDLRDLADADRERLFDEFNAESLPDYDDDMFQIGDEDDVDRASVKQGAGQAGTEAESGPGGNGKESGPSGNGSEDGAGESSAEGGPSVAGASENAGAAEGK